VLVVFQLAGWAAGQEIKRKTAVPRPASHFVRKRSPLADSFSIMQPPELLLARNSIRSGHSHGEKYVLVRKKQVGSSRMEISDDYCRLSQIAAERIER
jgi:hypothetical protein